MNPSLGTDLPKAPSSLFPYNLHNKPGDQGNVPISQLRMGLRASFRMQLSRNTPSCFPGSVNLRKHLGEDWVLPNRLLSAPPWSNKQVATARRSRAWSCVPAHSFLGSGVNSLGGGSPISPSSLSDPEQVTSPLWALTAPSDGG